jgi:hypothetical protein
LCDVALEERCDGQRRVDQITGSVRVAETLNDLKRRDGARELDGAGRVEVLRAQPVHRAIEP